MVLAIGLFGLWDQVWISRTRIRWTKAFIEWFRRSSAFCGIRARDKMDQTGIRAAEPTYGRWAA